MLILISCQKRKREKELVLELHNQFHKAEGKWCPHSFILGPGRKLQDYFAATLINIPNCCIQVNSPYVHVNLKMLENQLKSNILEVVLTLRNLMLQYETPSPHFYPHTDKICKPGGKKDSSQIATQSLLQDTESWENALRFMQCHPSEGAARRVPSMITEIQKSTTCKSLSTAGFTD